MNQEKFFYILTLIRAVFTSFGIAVFFLVILLLMGGDQFPAEDISSYQMFQLGNRGLALDTLLQFFLATTGCTLLAAILNSNLIFKKVLVLWRIVITFLGIVIYVSGIIILFDWFPEDRLSGWVGFAVSFTVFFLTGMSIMIFKIRFENKKYEKVLKDFQDRKAENENES